MDSFIGRSLRKEPWCSWLSVGKLTARSRAAARLSRAPLNANVRRHLISRMSWEISVQDLPRNVDSVDKIPDDFEPKPLGNRTEIIDGILALFPSADFTDPAWGIIDSGEFTIEVNLGADELVSSFALHVRGQGNAPAAIQAILDHFGYRAFDLSAGDIFRLDTASSSYSKWQKYRKQVLGNGL